MTRQSKRNILEELLTRLAVIEAKVDYLVECEKSPLVDYGEVDEAPSRHKPDVIGDWPVRSKDNDKYWNIPPTCSELGPFINAQSATNLEFDIEFPSGVVEFYGSLEDRFGGPIEINTAIIGDATIDTRTQAEAITDAYFNGKDWVERPEDLSYIQKFYKEKGSE